MSRPPAFRANEARALTTLFRHGAMTRAALARRLGLTRSTTGNLVQGLTEAGLVRERSVPDDEGGTRLGRPGILVEIVGDGAFFVGADIGVDRTDVIAVDLSGRVRAFESRTATAAGGRDPGETVAAMLALVRGIVETLPGGARIGGFCVAIPGFPAADGTSYHAILLGWHGVALADRLREAFGRDVPLRIENDANAFAVAETYRPAGEDGDPEDVLVVLIENGVGAGIVGAGRLHRGLLRGAGELGHIPLGAEGYVFDAARPGRLESFVGKNAVLARAAFRSGRHRGLDEILDDLKAGEPTAVRTAEDWADWLARGLVAATCLLQPRRIIVGGSVAAIVPFVADRIEASIRGALVEGYPVPSLQPATPGPGRPALGAAYLMHQAMLSAEPTPSTRGLRTDPEGPPSS